MVTGPHCLESKESVTERGAEMFTTEGLVMKEEKEKKG